MTIPNRSQVLTEQRNVRTMGLHRLSVAELVRTIRQEDEAVLRAMEQAEPALTAFIEEAEPRFTAGGRLVYFGAGTSGRLGVLDASEAPPTFHVRPDRVVGFIAGGDSALRKSSEGAEDDPAGAHPQLDQLNLTPLDTVVGIAAGGTTPYVLGGLEHVNRTHPKTLTALLTCSPPPDQKSLGHVIHLPTGPEVVTGSTRMKAGTATKLALNTISTTLMIREGRVYENLMVDLRATNAKLRDRAARIIATLTDLDRDASLQLLEKADGEVKTAIVMHHRHVTAADARLLLSEHRHQLHDLL